MANFFGDQHATVIQMGETITNSGPVVGTGAVQVRNALTDIRALVEADLAATDGLRDALNVAETEAAADVPERGRLASAVERIKELATGLRSAAQITESTDQILSVLNGVT